MKTLLLCLAIGGALALLFGVVAVPQINEQRAREAAFEQAGRIQAQQAATERADFLAIVRANTSFQVTPDQEDAYVAWGEDVCREFDLGNGASGAMGEPGAGRSYRALAGYAATRVMCENYAHDLDAWLAANPRH